jgi:hypothetical protein
MATVQVIDFLIKNNYIKIKKAKKYKKITWLTRTR